MAVRPPTNYENTPEAWVRVTVTKPVSFTGLTAT